MPSSRSVQSLRLVVHVGFAVAILAYVGLSVVDAQMRSAAVMQSAAVAFVNALSADQKTKATMAFDDRRREEWHFVPRGRKGLAVRDMSEAQKRLALALVDTIGPIGSKKVRAIMLLDDLLRTLEPEKIKLEGHKGEIYEVERGSGYYSFVVYGTPAAKGTWGWSAEGHHVSVNVTVVDGRISSTPFFLGSDPAEVKDGPQKGLRVLAAEEDLARELVLSFDDAQRKIAVVSPVTHGDIVTFNQRKADPLYAPQVGVWSLGLPVSKMTSAQKGILRRLLDTHLSNMPEEVAAERGKRLYASDFDQIFFAWTGSLKRAERYYYRVQGPTFLLEHDQSQPVSGSIADKTPNHIHNVWREFDGDFGADLLRQHYNSTAHAAPLVRDEPLATQ
jgi:Protein of unknown function (DUF3500)